MHLLNKYHLICFTPDNTSSFTINPILKTVESLSSGYWDGNIWKSLILDQDQFQDKHQIGECLRDKKVFFIGDSTLLKIYEEFCIVFGVPNHPQIEHDKHSPLGALPTFIHLEDYNLTINKAFHHIRVGLPRHFTFAVFEVDVLDSLGEKESCDYVILLGFGIHFRQWSRDAFIDRVTYIKSAISRFRKRCPQTPIIIKGPHMSTGPQFAAKAYQQVAMGISDFFVHEMREILRLHFQDNSDVLFFDTWDMNLSFPAPDEIHMPVPVVKQELYMLLSMICL